MFSALKETLKPKIALLFDVTTQDVKLPFRITRCNGMQIAFL
jgi:hypothetical protein